MLGGTASFRLRRFADLRWVAGASAFLDRPDRSAGGTAPAASARLSATGTPVLSYRHPLGRHGFLQPRDDLGGNTWRRAELQKCPRPRSRSTGRKRTMSNHLRNSLLRPT